jgi:Flp pilus assembly protein TadG
MRRAKRSTREKERGSVLTYTVLSVLFLFFAVGLGVDLSHLYLVKAELQNTADAAALAGASALTLPDDTRITTAVDRAVTVMNQNKYNFNKKEFVDVMSVAAQRDLVRFAVNLSEFDNNGAGRSEADATAAPANIRFVRVITPNVPVNIFFSIPILGATREMTARAVSGLSIPGNVSVCIAPLSAIYDPNADMPEERWGTCPAEDGRGPHDPQPVPPSGPDPDENGTCNPKREFCKRCEYTIRAQGAGGPSAGNYQILACAGKGKAVVRQALARYNNCQCGLKSVGDDIEIPTEPGEGAGAVAQGLNVRFDMFGAGGLNYSADIPPDTNVEDGASSGHGTNEEWVGITWGQYKAGSPFRAPSPSHPGVANRRVLIIPTIDIIEFGAGGRTTVRIGGLGGFFMKSRVNGSNENIKVEYIGDEIISVIGFDPNDDNVTNIVTPVLYR